jgi:hypothetical protein
MQGSALKPYAGVVTYARGVLSDWDKFGILEGKQQHILCHYSNATNNDLWLLAMSKVIAL